MTLLVCTEQDEVWVGYLTLTVSFGYADGKTVSNSIMSSLKNDNVPLSQLLALGSTCNDPNDKTIEQLLEEDVKITCPDFSGFVYIGTFYIHIYSRF